MERQNQATYTRRQFLLALGGAGLVALCPKMAQAAAPHLSADFIELNLRAASFNLRAWLRPGQNDWLQVFIEGDGNIWQQTNYPSFDPTPHNSVSAVLANDTPRPDHVLYLARPGQYASREELKNLSSQWWSSHRYAPQVVEAMVRAIKNIQLRTGAAKLGLYGHSGGGALAVLAAPELSPTMLGTVGSPLDTATWTERFSGASLPYSLNPKNVARQLRHIPQIHLSGAKDRIVPTPVLDAWLKELEPLPQWVIRKIVPNADHSGPWLSPWRLTLASALAELS